MKLIDPDQLEHDMYHNTFGIDTNYKKWDDRIWIRYKMFKDVLKEQPTVEAIPIEFIEKYIEYQDAEEKKVLRMMRHTWELWGKENG